MMEHLARSLPTRIFSIWFLWLILPSSSQLVYPPQVNLRLRTARSMCVCARLLTVTNAWMVGGGGGKGKKERRWGWVDVRVRRWNLRNNEKMLYKWKEKFNLWRNWSGGFQTSGWMSEHELGCELIVYFSQRQKKVSLESGEFIYAKKIQLKCYTKIPFLNRTLSNVFRAWTFFLPLLRVSRFFFGDVEALLQTQDENYLIKLS